MSPTGLSILAHVSSVFSLFLCHQLSLAAELSSKAQVTSAIFRFQNSDGESLFSDRLNLVSLPHTYQQIHSFASN